MSKGRMEDLLSALRRSGWRLLDVEEYPRGSVDPFVLEDDGARWGVVASDGTLVQLEFSAFGDLGQRTDRLRDILYCVEVGTGRKLYFDKREDPQWKANVRSFVANLGRPEPE